MASAAKRGAYEVVGKSCPRYADESAQLNGEDEDDEAQLTAPGGEKDALPRTPDGNPNSTRCLAQSLRPGGSPFIGLLGRRQSCLPQHR